MRRFVVLMAVLAGLVGLPAIAFAQTGVVLMHGKWGTPLPRSPVGMLATELRSAGFRVVAPDMPWSRSRLYDAPLSAAMREIDAAVGDLRRQGARKIVVGGHSMGANMALAYGARRSGIAGILMMAPGHRPEGGRAAQLSASGRAEARRAVAAGQNRRSVTVSDLNQGRERSLTMSARAALDYFSPSGPAVMPLNAPRLKPGTPLLWIIGERDRLVAAGRGYVFTKVPPHPKNAYIVVRGGHRATPKIGRNEIIAWLRRL
ncbi:MAG: alpha/beta fold hydrolase [Alphaproteobacteria bacterium]